MANHWRSICVCQGAFGSSKVLQLATKPSFGVAVSVAVEMITKTSYSLILRLSFFYFNNYTFKTHKIITNI